MTRYFAQNTPRAGLEHMMMSVPGFQKRGGGMMILSRFCYKPEDVDCRYCLHYRRRSCQVRTCPYIAERLKSGAIEYLDLILEYFGHIPHAGLHKRIQAVEHWSGPDQAVLHTVSVHLRSRFADRVWDDAPPGYTTSGRVSDAELAAFQVLDNGQNDSGAPQGYAKDSRQVYFHNGDGKVKVIKGAEVSSFRSLGDTYFARDEKRIYAYGKQLPKAELTSWELLGHWYSRDARRVYYLNREIKGADRDSFVVCTPLDAAPLADHLARDKDHFYQNDEMIEETLWLERLHEMTQEP